jgi:hypothetical protein
MEVTATFGFVLHPRLLRPTFRCGCSALFPPRHLPALSIDMPRPITQLLAVLAWLTVGVQFYLSVSGAIADGSGAFRGVVNYFGYFTLITNILCAGILAAHGWGGAQPTSGGLGGFLRRPGVATTAATAIIIVGVVYHLILASQWDPQGIDLVVDTMLHTVLPIAFVGFWARSTPRGAVTFAHIPAWIGYPAGYAVYVFIRGELVGAYPYPFIDVAAIGYGAALRNAAGIAVVFVALAAILVGVNRVMGPASPNQTVPPEN